MALRQTRLGPGDFRASYGPSVDAGKVRARREPPRFRHVEVAGIEDASPRLIRVTLTGSDLEGFTVQDPAASVRVLLPPPGERELVMPEWNGNEFLLPGGDRPTIRTFTPRRVDPANRRLDIEIVVHGEGVASTWARAAEPGHAAAVSGPGRGYEVDTRAAAFLLAGDETAIPAMSQLLEVLPPETAVQVHVEAAAPEARLPMPDHPHAAIDWHDLPPGRPPGDALVEAVQAEEILPGTRVWAAGEAAAVQRIRRHLFEERGLSRSDATVRGYWKRGTDGSRG